MDADSIRIETDEDGFWLVVENSSFPYVPHRFRIDDPEALYDHVKAAIGPWLYERDHAKPQFREVYRETFGEDAPEDEIAALQAAAYSPDDPKYPAFHSTHADIWDAREGK